MNRFIFVIITLISFLFHPKGGLAYNSASQKLRWDINKIINNSCVDRTNVGIKIVSLKNKEILFSQNGDKLFIPASNMKLVSTAAALVKLHPDYTFKTKVLFDGKISENILKGNLYLKGFGDPLLVSERLWLISKDIYNQGIKVINGDIIVDDSFFDNERRGWGWKKNHGPVAYFAPVGASSLNFNVVTVIVEPGNKVGSKARVIIDPKTEYIEIVNQTTTTALKTKRRIYVDRVPNKNGNRDKIIIGGKIPINSKRILLYRNISNPPMYLGMVFREFLIKEGIKVKGNVRLKTAPFDASELSEYQSRELFRIIQYLNKLSNNFVAEQILKTMGAEIKGEPGTFGKGIESVKDFLDSLGIPRNNYTIADGSGLSRLNRLSPSQIVKVLTYMYNDFQVQGEYLSSLGVMGVDGSVDDRLENTFAKRRIRVKTGTLFGVSAISGYVQTNTNEILAFSILINEKRCSHYSSKKIQNKILLLLVNFHE